MIKMMIAFFKDLWKYRKQVKKQDTWIRKFAAKKNYNLNPSWMMRTNLEVWLSEVEAIFGKRYCPCFEPSEDAQLNTDMSCPCKFLDDEIAEYGTCHCALFGSPMLSKEGWKKSSARLMGEYQIPLKMIGGILDTRGQPLDSRRQLPVPDAMHQLKSTLNHYAEKRLTLIVAREQEALNLQKIAAYRGFSESHVKKDDCYEVVITLDDSMSKEKN